MLPTIASGNVASATAGGYEVANSCRFFSNTYMHRTNSGTVTDIDKYTISFWVKRSELSTANSPIFGSSGSGTLGDFGNTYMFIYFKDDDTLRWQEYHAGGGGANSRELIPSMLFRDVGAWYHIVCRFDSSQGTASDRMRIYVNGTKITSFATAVYPDEDRDGWFGDSDADHIIGGWSVEGIYSDFYLAEFVTIDGQSLPPTDFGEFDSDSPTIWKPKDVSGLTFGTYGYYLDFEDSDNLGDDESGNTNDLTEVNLAATDQASDSPTNNFCTVNPLDDFYQDAGFTEGNCKLTFKGTQSLYAYSTGTFGVSGGKWYWENKATSAGNHDNYGIVGRLADATSTLIGRNTDNYGYYNYNGKYSNAATDGTYREVDFSGGNVTWTTNDIIGIALDMDNDTVSFYKNNALTGTIDIIAPSTGFYYPAWNQVDGDAEVVEVNFGNPSYSLTSAANDANGYGNFEYAPPSGFLALCSKNLGSDGG